MFQLRAPSDGVVKTGDVVSATFPDPETAYTDSTLPVLPRICPLV